MRRLLSTWCWLPPLGVRAFKEIVFKNRELLKGERPQDWQEEEKFK